jgi:hypothetical protein
MTNAQALERGREAFQRKAWAESYRLLQAAEREAALEPEDLERLAMAGYLMGRDDESESAMARAHQTFLDRGEYEEAARAAFWVGFGRVGRGAMAPAAGWFARAERVLDERQLECVVRGYLLIPAAIQRIMQGDPAAGHAAFTQAWLMATRLTVRTWMGRKLRDHFLDPPRGIPLGRVRRKSNVKMIGESCSATPRPSPRCSIGCSTTPMCSSLGSNNQN